METVLIVIHLMIVVALAAVVLLQRSEGGALGIGGGGGGGFMTGRGQANALSRATAILGGLFFITSMSLTILANVSRAPTSVLDSVSPQVPQGAGPGSGGRQPARPATTARAAEARAASSVKLSSFFIGGRFAGPFFVWALRCACA
ncbi:MAG: hypothetical protein RJB09_2588 [Pseudomonadota bacterium]